MKLRESHEAQPSPDPGKPAIDVVEYCRSLTPKQLSWHLIQIQNTYGNRFQFDVLDSILSRATDEELRILHTKRKLP